MNKASGSTVFPTIEKYKEAVKYFAEFRKKEVIHNLGDEHAGIIFTNLFEQSNGQLRIVAGSLTSRISQTDEYLSALKGFLSKKDTKLYIMLDSIMDHSGNKNNSELDNFKSSRLSELLKGFQNKVEIILSSKRFYIKIDDKPKPIHFAVGDDSMYRLETDIKQRQAECCFNDSTFAKILSDSFDELYKEMSSDKSKIVSLAN
ncbi:hypothetical protein [Dysgonomonas termitidis]|uniref:Uncharacterized protein n=1 Tax=Dysgonomonas termitidis TaxID=1516126 RepID=A0ABV9KW07_9BACT